MSTPPLIRKVRIYPLDELVRELNLAPDEALDVLQGINDTAREVDPRLVRPMDLVEDQDGNRLALVDWTFYVAVRKALGQDGE